MPAEEMPQAKLNYQKLFRETISYEPTYRCTKVGRATFGPECSLYGF